MSFFPNSSWYTNVDGSSVIHDTLVDTTTNIEQLISQQVFIMATKDKKEFEEKSDEEKIKFIRAFSYEYLNIHCGFNYWYAMFDDSDKDNIKCEIVESINEAKIKALNGFTVYFKFIK